MPEQRIVIDILAKVKEKGGQGVHSAAIEDIDLIKEMGKEEYEVHVDKNLRWADIIQASDVHPQFFFKLKRKNQVTVSMVHFLPSTLDGSITLPKWLLNLYCKYVLAFYRRADEVVTVNPVYMKRLIDLGFNPEKVHFIPNFVSKENFHPLSIAEKIRLRKENKLDGDFVVFCCGQTQPRKGIYEYIQMAEDNPDCEFYWAGGFTFGRITADRKNILEKLKNCPPNFHWLGIISREKMNLWYNIADCYVTPSYDELFPMTILEAASVGLPIVVRNLPLYEPILKDKVLKVAGPDEPGVLEFSKAIKNLRQNPEIRSEYASKSAELSDRYSKENVFATWDSFYKTLLERYEPKLSPLWEKRKRKGK